MTKEELEKENAVLKERNIKDCKNFNKAVEEISEQLNRKHCQLTKAKDLLLRFIELKNKPCAAEHSVNMLLYENIRSEAEQFLKEVSE